MPRGRTGPRAVVVAVIGLLAAASARAGVGAEVSVANDYRYRGLSLTGARPVALFGLDLDQNSGLYASALVAFAPNEDDRLVAAAERAVAGVAQPIGAGVILDGGAEVTAARQPGSSVTRAAPEVYMGLRRGGLALYAAYSPAYYGSGTQTLYVEASASYRTSSRLRLFARAGLLSQLTGAPYSAGARADFGLGAATRIAGFGLRAEITTVALNAFDTSAHRSALTVTLTRAF